jgi:hypothetical protein
LKKNADDARRYKVGNSPANWMAMRRAAGIA